MAKPSEKKLSKVISKLNNKVSTQKFRGAFSSSSKKISICSKKTASKLRKIKLPKKLKATHVLLLITLILIITSLYFFIQYKNLQKQGADEEDFTEVKNHLMKFMHIPEEAPTIIRLNDLSKLESQSFYKDAMVDDLLIVFRQEQKVILYRPSTKKVVNFASVSLNPQDIAFDSLSEGLPRAQEELKDELLPPSARIPAEANPLDSTSSVSTTNTPLPSPTPASQNKVSDEYILQINLSNSTDSSGLMNVMENTLKNTYQGNYNIISRGNAVNDYPRNLIVDLTGGNTEPVEHLSNIINADISDLPAGEVKPEGDILIIIGADYVEPSE